MLLEALKIIGRLQYSEMKMYCVINKIHYGISDSNAACLAQRIAQDVVSKIELMKKVDYVI